MHKNTLFHLPLQTAVAAEYVHRRNTLMVVSILHQYKECKGIGVQRTERQQQEIKERTELLLNPEFIIGLFSNQK
jgi:hypothetical protein